MFRRCTFDEADLAGVDLSGAVFEQCSLAGATLGAADVCSALGLTVIG